MKLVAPMMIMKILADPKFHANLKARAAAHHAGTHSTDAAQNKTAAAIEKLAGKVGTSGLITKWRLGVQFVLYINRYYPDL